MPPTDPSAPIDPSAQAQGVQNMGNAAQNAQNQLTNYNLALEQARENTESYNQVANMSSTILNQFNGSLLKASNYFKDGTAFTREQANAFSALGVTVMGATKAFSLMTDNSNVVNFSGQLNAMIEVATKSTSPLAAMTQLAKDFGLNITPKGSLQQQFGTLTTALKDAAKNIGQAADESLKFSNVNFQLLATSGQLNDIWDQGRIGLSALNEKLQDQSKMITATAGATGILLPTLGQYYQQLGKIPGALTQIVTEGGKGGQQVSLFQKAVQLASGTGRDFQAVVNDMSTAFENYGKTGNDALLFTARMTEQANNFGISVADTKGFMDNMSGAFRMLGDNAEGTSKIFSEFFGQLRNTGLGVKPSIEIMEQMTGAMSKMSVAQEAFISRRGGGPGGLLGAVQMEKDLREGKTDEVFAKMRQTFMSQIGGKIMTQGDVKTQGDASQFEKQRQLLMSSAMGGMAGTKDQATRILEAFAKGPEQGKFKEGGELLKETIQMGSNIEQKSLTQLVDVNKHLEEIRMQGGMSALSFAQKAFTTAGTGAVAQNITSNMAESARQGREATNQQGGDKTQMYGAQAFGGLMKNFSDVATSSGSALKRAYTETFSKPEGPSGPKASDLGARLEVDRARVSRGGMVGQAVQQAGTHMAAGTTASRPGPPAGGVMHAPIGPDKIDLTVNVNVDGKKLMQSQQQLALQGGEPIHR